MLYQGSRPIKRLYRGSEPIKLLVRDGRRIFPCRKPAREPSIRHRITEQSGSSGLEKWFEVGFIAPRLLSGNATDGWTDPVTCLTWHLERSETLTAWTLGEFIDCAGSPAANGDGTYTYWARSIFPINSTISTGNIWCESGGPQIWTPDARNNPFTALTLGGVAQALPGFPYTMPTDAARMQADLRTIGWAGATVVAASNLIWRIDIPNVALSAYYQLNAVHWPVYYVADMYGVVNTPVSSRHFAGEFINASGVRTKVSKQFFRLGKTPPF